MIIQTKTFTFSERILTSRRRSMYVLAAGMMILVPFGALIEDDFDVQRLLASYSPIPLFVAVMIIGLGLFLTIFIVVGRYIFQMCL